VFCSAKVFHCRSFGQLCTGFGVLESAFLNEKTKNSRFYFELHTPPMVALLPISGSAKTKAMNTKYKQIKVQFMLQYNSYLCIKTQKVHLF
jgi:hypothetical protein